MIKYFSTVLWLGIAVNVQAQLPSKVLTNSAPVSASTSASTGSAVAVRPATVAFKTNATYISGEPVANSTPKKIDFNGNPLFDEGKNFSMQTDEFLVPSNGIYHFDVRVGWDQFTAPGMVTVSILTNWYSAVPASTFLPASTTSFFDTNYSTMLSLKAGDKISVEIKQNSGRQQTFKQTQFCGYKVN